MYAGNEYEGYGGASYGASDYYNSDGYPGNNNIGKCYTLSPLRYSILHRIV